MRAPARRPDPWHQRRGQDRDLDGVDGLPNPWFIGFAPAEDPTIATAVFFEGSPELGESATGGGVAAPLAAELIELWLEGIP